MNHIGKRNKIFGKKITQMFKGQLPDCSFVPLHWNENVSILIKFSSLAAPEVVKMTTSSAASDENFVKMTTFLFPHLRDIVSVL